MFKFLKDKLKSAISSFSKKAEEEAKEETVEKPKKEDKKPSEKTGKKKEAKPVEAANKPIKEPIKEPVKEPEEKKPKKPAVKAEKKEEKPAAEKISEEKKAEKKPGSLDKEEKVKEKISEEKPETAEKEKADKPAVKKEEPAEHEKKPEGKKGFFGRLKDRFTHKEEEGKEEEKEELPEKEDKVKEKISEETPEPADEKEAGKEEEPEEEEPQEEEKPEDKKRFFARVREAVSTKVLSEKQFEEMFWELEIALLENNVAMEVVEKIKDDLKHNLVDKRIGRGKFEERIAESLVSSISSLFDIERIDLDRSIKQKKPYVLVFVGVNGSGKTTTIAKIARLMQDKGLKPVIAAADTFRAAAIQQLEEHGNNLGVKVIKHDYGSDPAAVAFDAIKYAKSKGLDVVLIDTAGRQHSNTNLMDEMKKIIRVAQPDLKVFIGESITGNDCIEQAKAFNDAIDIDAVVLTKADIDEKGGTAVSVSYVTGKPILFIGMGQEYNDLKEFNKELIMENIGLG